MAKRAQRPAVGINPNIPLVIQRDLRIAADAGFTAQDHAARAQETANGKLGPENLFEIASYARNQYQPGGKLPMSITGLPGRAGQPQVAGVPNLGSHPTSGPYSQPQSLYAVNGVLYGYRTTPGGPILPFISPNATLWGWYVDAIAANAVTPDLSQGATHVVTLNQAQQVTINNPVHTSALQTGQPVTLYIAQDGAGGRPTPVFGTAYVGLNNFYVAPDADTYTVLNFRLAPSGNLFLADNYATGIPLNGVALA